MTKKHFIDMADMIREHNRQAELPYQEITAFTKDQIEVLAYFCRQQNPRFNRERWLNYIAGECGPSGGAVKKERAA